MLSDIAAICDKYEIPYFLVGGTALGAMRHGGFIPWDDDIDIAMYRQDYEKFLTCFASESAGKYYLQSPEYTDGYPSLITRVRKCGSVVQSREDLWTDEKNSGPWVDIFVIENTFDNRFLRYLHGMLCLFGGGLLACRKIFAIRKKLRNFIIPGSAYARKVRLRSFIGGCFAWLPVNFVRKFALCCFKLCKNRHSRLVTLPSGHWRFFGDMYERRIFGGNRMTKFNNLSFFIPAEVEKYLSHCYSDWRQIPTDADKEQHFFCAFTLDRDNTDEPDSQTGNTI